MRFLSAQLSLSSTEGSQAFIGDMIVDEPILAPSAFMLCRCAINADTCLLGGANPFFKLCSLTRSAANAPATNSCASCLYLSQRTTSITAVCLPKTSSLSGSCPSSRMFDKCLCAVLRSPVEFFFSRQIHKLAAAALPFVRGKILRATISCLCVMPRLLHILSCRRFRCSSRRLAV